jgi:hypothetical protein
MQNEDQQEKPLSRRKQSFVSEIVALRFVRINPTNVLAIVDFVPPRDDGLEEPRAGVVDLEA